MSKVIKSINRFVLSHAYGRFIVDISFLVEFALLLGCCYVVLVVLKGTN